MSRPIFIIYSNLGLGGMPVRITDIVNKIGSTHPNTGVYIVLKEQRDFDLRAIITNPNVHILDFYRWCPFDSSVLFMLWAWYHIFQKNPTTILGFISPYALTILASRMLFFWRDTRILINEGHYTSTILQTMALPWLQSMGIRLLYPNADSIIVPTKAIQDNLINEYRIPSEKIVVISNWSRYALGKLPTNLRPFDLIYAGRLEDTKQILPLLQLCRDIICSSRPSLTLLLVGEGSQKDACLRFIQEHKLERNIFVLAPIINISTLMRRAKLYICNSIGSAEGFPVAMLDALSLGTLVITKRFEGVDEVLDEKSGYIVTTDAEMREKIEYSLSRLSTLRSKIARAKRIAKTYHSIHNIYKYLQLFYV